MNNERDYISEIKEGFKKNDKKLIEDVINDFYYEYRNSFDYDDDNDKYYEDLDKMIGIIYDKIKKDGSINKDLDIRCDFINEGLLDYLVYPCWDKLKRKINPVILSDKSLSDPGETNEEKLLTEMNYIAENIFYRHYEDRHVREIMDKQTIDFLEDNMQDLSNLILMGRESNQQIDEIENQQNEDDRRSIKKFRGNSLAKRNTNEKNYIKVAKILKVAGDSFPQLRITQKIACEIVNCNEFSFARWKNYNNNFDLFLKWQREITKEEIETIKKEIRDHLKLHSDM